MKRFRDDADLSVMLRALRPTPRPAFTAELDERAAAGFPRRAGGESPFGRLRTRVRAMRPRQVLLPAGATALAAIAVATAVVAIDKPGSDSNSGSNLLGLTSADNGGSGQELQASPAPERVAKPAPEATLAEELGSETGASAASQGFNPTVDGGGRYAAGSSHRAVQRSAQMVLGTEPAAVRDAAGQVFEAVHANAGIVLRSSIRDGEDEPRAVFDLLIPSAKLSDALAAFSGIGQVRYRHETTDDITAPTVTTAEQLQDSRARIDGLLAQLAEADTESEREAVEAELRTERRRAAVLRSQLSRLHRRANLSHVSLRIESGDASTPTAGSSSWGIGDALHDAGRILGIAGAVAVVGLAVLAPFAVVALLAWLGHRAWLRRGRERALG